jgi:phosphoribosylaminoimidazole-succinocarboxamide synthase
MKEYNSLAHSNFNFPGQTKVYHGKVRDVYTVNGKMVMIATDRISAFDHILPRAIPFKGQVLNQIAAYFLENTKDIVPNWLEACPDPNVSIGKQAEPIKLEMVIRGYLAGHSWRTYNSGDRTLCGVDLPEGMKQNDRFPNPIITPATKAEEGHDEDISAEEIISKGLVTLAEWDTLCHYTRALFAKGTEMAAKRGLILVDTKYEFGKVGDEIILIDEIHTPDSSRYFYKEGYQERQDNNESQKQLSKEFVREWLMDNGFQGKDGQDMPDMPTDFVNLVSERYIELYERVTGEKFVKADVHDIVKRIEKNVVKYLS